MRKRSDAAPGEPAAGEAQALFERLVSGFGGDPSVTPPTGKSGGFGASAWRVDGKIFAMLSNGRLVVKLPARRVEELIETGTGERFDPGHGRLMREWVTLATSHGPQWPSVAAEARRFVGRGR